MQLIAKMDEMSHRFNTSITEILAQRLNLVEAEQGLLGFWAAPSKIEVAWGRGAEGDRERLWYRVESVDDEPAWVAEDGKDGVLYAPALEGEMDPPAPITPQEAAEFRADYQRNLPVTDGHESAMFEEQ